MTLQEFIKELQDNYKGHIDPLLDYYGENQGAYQVIVEDEHYYFSLEVCENKELIVYVENKSKQEDVLEETLDISSESFTLIRDILEEYFPDKNSMC
jgi:hypothetical protein